MKSYDRHATTIQNMVRDRRARSIEEGEMVKAEVETEPVGDTEPVVEVKKETAIETEVVVEERINIPNVNQNIIYHHNNNNQNNQNI